MNTPDRILRYLQTHPQTSAPELSRIFGLSVQNIRHHLVRLHEGGQIEALPAATPERKGRPVKYYRLSSRAAASSLEPFWDGLMIELLDGKPDTEEPSWLAAVARRIAAEDYQATRNPAQRLNRAIKRMAQIGYTAHWEARQDEPRIYLHYSPFRMLMQRYPTLSSLDRLIIECLTGYPLELHSSSLEGQGTGSEVFAIHLR